MKALIRKDWARRCVGEWAEQDMNGSSFGCVEEGRRYPLLGSGSVTGGSRNSRLFRLASGRRVLRCRHQASGVYETQKFVHNTAFIPTSIYFIDSVDLVPSSPRPPLVLPTL